MLGHARQLEFLRSTPQLLSTRSPPSIRTAGWICRGANSRPPVPIPTDMPRRECRVVRTSGLCCVCDSRFRDQEVLALRDEALPRGWAYVELRHVSDPGRSAAARKDSSADTTDDRPHWISRRG